MKMFSDVDGKVDRDWSSVLWLINNTITNSGDATGRDDDHNKIATSQEHDNRRGIPTSSHIEVVVRGCKSCLEME